MNESSEQHLQRIVIFDMNMTASSPAGSCVLAEINGLSDTYRILAVTGELQNDHPDRIEWLRIPLPRGPVLLRYLVFHALAPFVYALWRLSAGQVAIVQATQGQHPSADICYAHFCHRAYLKTQWLNSAVSGPRRWARWMSHQFNAFFEKRAFERCRVVVVPSKGLARELVNEYPETLDKIEVIPNPVSMDRFARPADFNRSAARMKLGLAEADLVLSFMALGDFSRKGLGLLIEAMGKLDEHQRSSLKILVIGGQAGEIETFRSYAARHNVEAHLVFVGLQKEVASYLWATDVFVLPSSYETFSLAAFQAAACGLPVMVSTDLYGPEELILEGINGWQVPRDTISIHKWILLLIRDRDKLEVMSCAAVESVRQYSQEAFIARWHNLYRRLRGL